MALEQNGPARSTPHALGESAVGEEKVESLYDFFDNGVRADNVGQCHPQLFGAVQHVRRTTGHKQWAGHNRAK